MGTRSLTRVFDEHGQAICCLYRQYDGYPSGHGKDLAEFLAPITVVNGLGALGARAARVANGMGCLAAQLVAHLKKEPGNFYLYSADTSDVGEEYVYEVHPGRLVCTAVYGAEKLYDGPADAFAAWAEKEDG